MGSSFVLLALLEIYKDHNNELYRVPFIGALAGKQIG
jgi:uncharacterized membrane protein